MCLDCGRGRVPVPPSRYRPDLGRGSRPFWNGGFLPPGPFLEDEKKSRIKAGVAVGASGRLHLPAVRAFTRVFGVSKVGSKTAGENHVCGHAPREATAATKNRGHTRLLRYERHPFRIRRPTSGIAPHETKIEARPKNQKIRCLTKKRAEPENCELFDNSAPCPWLFPVSVVLCVVAKEAA